VDGIKPLTQIMQEQEDERLAYALQQNQSAEEEYWEQLRLAQQLSLAETYGNQQDTCDMKSCTLHEISEDLDYDLIKTHTEIEDEIEDDEENEDTDYDYYVERQKKDFSQSVVLKVK